MRSTRLIVRISDYMINRLIADGRMDEIGKIIDSAEACRELYKEYGL